jgi:hypothetical protein
MARELPERRPRTGYSYVDTTGTLVPGLANAYATFMPAYQ